MSVRKTGRKARALERAKFGERAMERLRRQGVKSPKYSQIRQNVESKTPKSGVNAVEIREELGFVVPKAHFRESHRSGGFFGNWKDVRSPVRGICACGCGGRTTQARHDTKYYKAGDYAKFINGHQWIVRRQVLGRTYKSQYELTRERQELASKIAATALKLKRQKGVKQLTFSEVRSAAGNLTYIDPLTKRQREVTNWGLSRMANLAAPILGEEMPKFFTPVVRMAPVEPITTYYPYIQNSNLEGTDLLMAVNRLIPWGWGNEHRADIAQDILLEIVSGLITLEEVPSQMRRFGNAYWRRFGSNHMMVSFDAQREHDGATMASLHELVDGSVLQEMYGGFNYETKATEYDRCEDWDGQICARY